MSLTFDLRIKVPSFKRAQCDDNDAPSPLLCPVRHGDIGHVAAVATIVNDTTGDGCRPAAKWRHWTAAQIVRLTSYDICKAVEKEMVMNDIRIIEKREGKSDHEHRGPS